MNGWLNDETTVCKPQNLAYFCIICFPYNPNYTQNHGEEKKSE
jgi:hypothetical protein